MFVKEKCREMDSVVPVVPTTSKFDPCDDEKLEFAPRT